MYVPSSMFLSVDLCGDYFQNKSMTNYGHTGWILGKLDRAVVHSLSLFFLVGERMVMGEGGRFA